MIRLWFTVAAIAALAGSHWWAWSTGQEHGRREIRLDVQETRDRLEVALQRQAQIARAAAEDLRAAELARDRAIKDALDALAPDDRHLGVSPAALGLLRSIQ